MDPSCLGSTVQAGDGGVMVRGINSWHTFGHLVPIEHYLNATAYLSIVADHVHPFMSTVYSSSDGYFEQHHITKLKSSQSGFLNQFLPPESPDLNPIEQLCDLVEREIRIMDVQLTNL